MYINNLKMCNRLAKIDGDPTARLSDEVVAKVERAEELLMAATGRMQEFGREALAVLLATCKRTTQPVSRDVLPGPAEEDAAVGAKGQG